MTKSAMEQMVFILEGNAKSMQTHKTDFGYGAKSAYESALSDARRLLLEEQAQKPPTDMAGLVEDVDKQVKYLEAECDCDCCLETREALTNILSRYRPVPSSADEGSRAWKEKISEKLYSAIEKMVEWLEEKVNPNNNEILSNADHLVVETYHEALKKAISLLAEEQAQDNTPAITGKLITGEEWAEYRRFLAQKPTAPAIMASDDVRVLKAKCAYLFKQNEQLAKMCANIDIHRPIVVNLPAPSSADEGLRDELEDILDLGDDVAKHMDITIKGEPTVLVSYIKEIISRHPSTKENKA